MATKSPGISSVVSLYESYVRDTFDDWPVWGSIEKAIPEAMAQTILEGGNDRDVRHVDIREWVIQSGDFAPFDEAQGEFVGPLSAHKLLRMTHVSDRQGRPPRIVNNVATAQGFLYGDRSQEHIDQPGWQVCSMNSGIHVPFV